MSVQNLPSKVRSITNRATSSAIRHSIPSTYATASVRAASYTTFLKSIPQSRSLKPLQRQFRSHTSTLRYFQSTAAPLEKAIINPRTDEDGHEMTLEITPRAANRLTQIMTSEAQPNLCLRISVESGGCHGFQYLMSLTDLSKINDSDDTVFEGRGGAKVVLDEPSLELLKGSKVDYTMELIGSQFKIVDNPLATSSCGCGTSFDIKI